MNLDDPRFWLDACQTLGLVVLSAVTWLRRPGEQAAQAVAELAKRTDGELAALATRLQAVEERMQHMPTDEELAQLGGDVKEVKAVVEGQRELLKRVEHQQSLILEQLMMGRK